MTRAKVSLRGTLVVALIAVADCTPREEREARKTAEQAKQALNETGRELKVGAKAAAEQVKEATREVREETPPLLDKLGDRLKRAAARLESDTADERQAAAREANETLDDVDRWLDDVGPRAKARTRTLATELRAMTRELRRDIERLGNKTGPALDRARADVNKRIGRIEQKLEEARDSEGGAP